MPTYSGLSTVETREAAWLSTYGDSLPALTSQQGGPWEVLQAFWTRTPGTKKRQLYVTSLAIDDERYSNQRIMPHYEITLVLHWPIRATTSPLAEREQQAFKQAIDLTLQRIRGPLGDKTHGGAFLSVGEAPRSPGAHATMEPPWVTIPVDSELRGTITYFADDYEVID